MDRDRLEGLRERTWRTTSIRLLHAIDIERVKVVGHELGGLIGSWSARQPERVEQLDTMNMPLRGHDSTPRDPPPARRFAFTFGLAAPFIGSAPAGARSGLRPSRGPQGGGGRLPFPHEAADLRSRPEGPRPRPGATALLYGLSLVRGAARSRRGRDRKSRPDHAHALLRARKDRIVPAQSQAASSATPTTSGWRSCRTPATTCRRRADDNVSGPGSRVLGQRPTGRRRVRRAAGVRA